MEDRRRAGGDQTRQGGQDSQHHRQILIAAFNTAISWNLNITNIAGEDRADPEPGGAAHGLPDPGAGVRPPQEDRQHHRDRGQGGGQHRVSPGGVE